MPLNISPKTCALIPLNPKVITWVWLRMQSAIEEDNADDYDQPRKKKPKTDHPPSEGKASSSDGVPARK
eukprot:4487117-Pyramimonas_sp.AAC.1